MARRFGHHAGKPVRRFRNAYSAARSLVAARSRARLANASSGIPSPWSISRSVLTIGGTSRITLVREWLPRAVNFFGPPDSGFTYDCIRYGLKTRDNGDLAELYLSLLERRLRNARLELPALTATYPHVIA